jgi:hypothetical protein
MLILDLSLLGIFKGAARTPQTEPVPEPARLFAGILAVFTV